MNKVQPTIIDKSKTALITTSPSDARTALYHSRMADILKCLGAHNYTFNGNPNAKKIPDSLRRYFELSQKDGNPVFTAIEPGTPEQALEDLQVAVKIVKDLKLEYPPKWLKDADPMAEPPIKIVISSQDVEHSSKPRRPLKYEFDPEFLKIPESPKPAPFAHAPFLEIREKKNGPSEPIIKPVADPIRAKTPIAEEKITGPLPAELHTGLTAEQIKQKLFKWLEGKNMLLTAYKSGIPRIPGLTLKEEGGNILSYLIGGILKLEKLDPRIPEFVTSEFLIAIGLSGFLEQKYQDTLWKLGYIGDDGWKQLTAKHKWPRLGTLKGEAAR